MDGAVKDIQKYDMNTVALAATNFVALYNFENVTKSIFLKSNARNRTILVAPDSSVYVGTSKGFWKYNKQTQKEILFQNESVFLEDMIWHNGKIFAASPKNGIICFENDKVLFNLTTQNGLTDNGINRIKVYKNKIWWLTEATLQQYDQETKKIITYDKSNGLPDTELKDLGFRNDSVYVATSQGIAYFPIDLHEKNVPQAPLIVSTLLFQQNKYDTKITNEFAHNENDIEIHFSILSFRNAEQLQVYYQINGQKWLKLAKNVRVLSLPALAPNDYSIKIKAENGKNISIAEINFVVKPPFWLSYWFLAICVWFLLFSFALIYLYRVKKLEQKAAQMAQKMALEQQLQKSLLSSIKSQMNPHFIFNALNTIQSYIYLNEKQNAANYLVKFSELTRMILDMSNSETVSLRDELKTIHLYLELEQMRFEDTLVYTIEIAKNIELDTTKIPSMLIQPYIENAIKHGLMHKKEDRKLSLNFSIQQHFLIVSVEDNGVGRKKANEINQQRASKHQSFATNANQKRLELLNIGFQEQIGIDFFDKFDENGRAAGTKVTLKIPMTTFNALQK
jgi:anti-sigma regulatory factor (Ser/Thr protein kinase)